MPRKTKSKVIAIKPNKVIQAGQEMSLFQNKVFMAALAMLEFNVNKSGIENVDIKEREKEMNKIAKTTYKINIEPFFDEFNKMMIYENSNNAKYIEEKLANLVKQVLKIRENGSFTAVSIMDYAHYEYGGKTIDIQFSKSIIPILIDMFKDGFTKIRIVSMFKFRSTYSMRIYEELLRVKNMENVIKIGHTLTVYEIFFMLGLDRNKEYKKWDDFRKRVLLPAQKEIKEKAGLLFEFDEIRQKNKVYQIRFYNIKEDTLFQQQEPLQLNLFNNNSFDNYVDSDSFPETKAQKFINTVLSNIKENIIEKDVEKSEQPNDNGIVDEQKPKFTEEQLDKLDKYLEGIFSADEIKSKYEFDFIEFYYKKAQEIKESGTVKNFTNFYYNLMIEDTFKFQALNLKKIQQEEKRIAKEKLEKERKKEKEQEEKKVQEHKKLEEKRLIEIFNNLSEDDKKIYLEKFYSKNDLYKETSISNFTKWAIGKMIVEERQ